MKSGHEGPGTSGTSAGDRRSGLGRCAGARPERDSSRRRRGWRPCAARRRRRRPGLTRSSPQTSERPTRSAGSRSAPAASSRRPLASIAPSRATSPAAFRQWSRATPAAAAASARISGSSRSKPPQNASRPAASTNAPPLPCSIAYEARASRPARRPGTGPATGAASVARRAPLVGRPGDQRVVDRCVRSRVATVECRRRRRAPGHLRKGAIDALGDQVGERAREVEEELRALRGHRVARRAGFAALARRCSASRIELVPCHRLERRTRR